MTKDRLPPPKSQSAFLERLLYALLVFDAFLLILPKIILITTTNISLWGNITWRTFPGAIAQDVFVAIITIYVAWLIIRRVSWKKLMTSAVLVGSILLLLLLDMRVRELWLKPIDVTLLQYVVNNATDLTSGSDLFFKHDAGFGMTFRKILFLVGGVHLIVWCVISWSATKLNDLDSNSTLEGKRPEWRWIMLLTAAGCGTLIIAMVAENYRYRMNENILVSSLVNPVRIAITHPNPVSLSLLAAEFEQKANPLFMQLKTERTILRDIKPFKNVVVVVYESVRWRSVGLKDNNDKKFPTLARLAAQGILSQSYVAVPHSSKAYFAILSGRYPYPAVEMRESVLSRHESLWHEFARGRKGSTFAFSSLFLGFENMGGLLNALGIDERHQTDDLARIEKQTAAASTSFGSSDELLYQLGAQRLEKNTGPFAAFFFPLAAHYPYECPGSGRDHSYLDYEACLQYSDKLLAGMIEEFRSRGLMQDTLFVIVGDHGESFGEHGLFVHNSSMYDEEVTVPLIFWSEDGRLANSFIPTSREIDIAPTIADLLGLMNSDVPVQGVSLLRRGSHVPPIFMATFFEGVAQALVEPPLKYIYEESADRLLAFNLDRDPSESSSEVITGNQKKEIIRRLKAFQASQEVSFPTR